MIRLLKCIKGSWLHPQWLSDRYHIESREYLSSIERGIVVDIGSGDSDHTELLGKEAELIKIDYPDTNCRYTKRPSVFGNAACLPLSDDSVDVVLLLEVIEHISDFNQVLCEVRRVLKNNGQLYLSAPFIYPAHDVPYDYHRFSIYGLRQDLLEAGLNTVREVQHGNSIVVSLQMINLALLELVKKSWSRSAVMGLLFAIPVYSVCLMNNLLAAPFLHLRSINAAVFGHFIIAEPR